MVELRGAAQHIHYRPERRPGIHANRGILVSGCDRRPGRNGSLMERDCRKRRPGKRMRLVQGQIGTVVADHATRIDGRDCRPRSSGSEARVRSDDADGKDRHRHDRSGSTWLSGSRGLLRSGLLHARVAHVVDQAWAAWRFFDSVQGALTGTDRRARNPSTPGSRTADQADYLHGRSVRCAGKYDRSILPGLPRCAPK